MAAIRGDRLKHLRQSMGLNQTELSEKLGIKSYQISKYERETSMPSLEALILLADVFNTTIDYLVGLSNIPHPHEGTEPVINERESELLDLFRQHSDDEQERALRILHALWDD